MLGKRAERKALPVGTQKKPEREDGKTHTRADKGIGAQEVPINETSDSVSKRYISYAIFSLDGNIDVRKVPINQSVATVTQEQPLYISVCPEIHVRRTPRDVSFTTLEQTGNKSGQSVNEVGQKRGSEFSRVVRNAAKNGEKSILRAAHAVTNIEGDLISQSAHAKSPMLLGSPSSSFKEKEASITTSIPGLKGCVLTSDGLLGPARATKPNWSGNVVIVDVAEKIFKKCSYVGKGVSGSLYKALGIFGTSVGKFEKREINEGKRVLDSGIFRRDGYSARVIHVSSMNINETSKRRESKWNLSKALYRTFTRTFAKLRGMSGLPGDTVVMIPVVHLGKCAGRSLQQQCFVEALYSSIKGFGDRSLPEALGVKEVRICCGDPKTHAVLAELMSQKASAGVEM
ncbi:hypothetical protein NSE_0108 [Neorickettsia sennetsu str. Miyayama]|uniref:Uncharacterized protein n=2 Tax=Ehrlichia sennetsu TaxID=951 RepID=Q2GET8_EHRS3|nr:hypothetical protein NSE_0108 [Neorickettsia sennetsu str. Miyayama]